MDGDTIFGIAPMSKSMTALACCILHAEGKLSLDDPITKYFPKLHIAGAPDECVTLKTVAMHRTGLPPLPPLEWSISLNSKEEDSPWHRYMMETAPNKMETIDQLVDYLAEGDFEPLGPPGEYMSYSNDGYALLSYVVDMAAGMTLEEFLDQRIFKPLGMERSVLDEDCSQAKAMAGGNITSLFEKDFETGQLYCDDDWSVLPPFRGCACVKSTADDMSRYYKMLADGGVWEGRQVIPAEAVELMVGREFPAAQAAILLYGPEQVPHRGSGSLLPHRRTSRSVIHRWLHRKRLQLRGSLQHGRCGNGRIPVGLLQLYHGSAAGY